MKEFKLITLLLLFLMTSCVKGNNAKVVDNDTYYFGVRDVNWIENGSFLINNERAVGTLVFSETNQFYSIEFESENYKAPLMYFLITDIEALVDNSYRDEVLFLRGSAVGQDYYEYNWLFMLEDGSIYFTMKRLVDDTILYLEIDLLN